MENFVIIGSGFSALIANIFLEKYNPLTISLDNNYLFKSKLNVRRNLNINKIFSSNTKSFGNFDYKLNNKTRIHDRISIGGHSNIWGGFINIDELKNTTLSLLKNNFSVRKINERKCGYQSNKDGIAQMRDNNENIIDSKSLIKKIENGFLDSFFIEPDYIKLKIYFKNKSNFEIIKTRKLILAISFSQLIDLLYRSKIILNSCSIGLSEFDHKFKKTMLSDIKQNDYTEDVIIKYDLIRAIKHFTGFQRSLDYLNFNIPFYIEQIFYNKKKFLELKLDYNNKLINEVSNLNKFGDSIHYCNLKIGGININEIFKNLSNNIVGISMPFTEQKRPGPISNDIINNFLNNFN